MNKKIGKMEKKIYTAPEFEIVDADWNSILVASGENGKDDEETHNDDAKAWGGDWFAGDGYDE